MDKHKQNSIYQILKSNYLIEIKEKILNKGLVKLTLQMQNKSNLLK
jgi:hypothetical protein